MKKGILIILIIGTMMIGVGYSHRANVRVNNPKTTTNKGIAYSQIKYEVLKYDNLSANLQSRFNSISHQKGYKIIKSGTDGYYMFIGAGQKSTGGYSLEIKAVENIDGKTKITVKENSPSSDIMVTQAITYPAVVVKLPKNISLNYTVLNDKGDIFHQIR